MRFSTVAPVLLSALLFAACTDTTGLSAESSRPPKGNVNAPVVVKVFSDLQCPACRAAHLSVTEPLLEAYKDKVRFDFMHFPLQSIHPYALRAAMASECAADQGKFWEYVDIAYQNQQELSARALEEWATELGLDGDLFKRCIDSQIKKKAVLADYEAARDLGLQGTPTFLVNEKITPTNQLQPAIDAAYEALTQRL
jgi:protein-disulfide isomerase